VAKKKKKKKREAYHFVNTKFFQAPFAAALMAWEVENGHDGTKLGRLPQAIAHRGYKAAFPENTMAAFRSAVEIGAHAIETDLHLSKDGVVVLSHVSIVSFPFSHFLFSLFFSLFSPSLVDNSMFIVVTRELYITSHTLPYKLFSNNTAAPKL
jgi:hypothetical protein